MAAIEEICGGQFVFHGGGKVTFKTGRAEYSANAIAEGFRKVGLLARLLETGAIQPGISGSLFWDEPESNLNPGPDETAGADSAGTVTLRAADHPGNP